MVLQILSGAERGLQGQPHLVNAGKQLTREAAVAAASGSFEACADLGLPLIRSAEFKNL